MVVLTLRIVLGRQFLVLVLILEHFQAEARPPRRHR